MATPNYVRLIVRSWRQILLAALLGLVLVLAFSLVQPLRYSSSVKLLITQTNATGLDPYTAVKSTERIAQNLTGLMYTSGFFEAVVNDQSVDRDYFPTDDIDRRKKWENTIRADASPGTGVLTITAYHTDRGQASAIAKRTAQEITNQTPLYFGVSVRAQTIDAPQVSRWIAKPNFVVNGMYGLIAGVLLGLAWVLGSTRE